ncbi:MAG: radical SAM family heme chaperone HemW [Muribaculaceae bacterium]|nr:radical SAM family heme chaperone HemW [Muribaculaceae bacterium]
MDSRKTEDFGIYIHFPFCRTKCKYCSFFKVGEDRADWERYARAVENEYKSRRVPEGEVASLYMGGGTPSLAPASVIKRFREMIPFEIGEFTIEVNPDDVTEEKAIAWKDAGVNRVSMGVQSLIDEELKVIGRRHTADQAVKAYNILRKYFSNISLDLIFGIPGQTISSLTETLDSFLKLRPEHISAYSLMYEGGTTLTRMRDSGSIVETDEDDSVKMFRLINKMFHEAGYERYEISNYSLPGYRSHHNSSYWLGVPYMGLGPGAHSYDGRSSRFWNSFNLEGYLEIYGDESNNVGLAGGGAEKEMRLRKLLKDYVEYENLTGFEMMEEMVMTRLRMVEGLSLQEYKKKFGESAYKELKRKSEKYIKSGDLYYRNSNYLALTEKGVMISDDIISSLF